MTGHQPRLSHGDHGEPTPGGDLAVIGGGRMGVGIAHAFLLAGWRALIIDRDEQSISAAATELERIIHASIARGVTNYSAPDLLARSRYSVDLSNLGESEEHGQPSLIVEAVPENLELKQHILRQAEESAPEAWLATNTSSLSITSLAQVLARPERLIGLHFFNPVPASELVEVVLGRDTAAELIDAANGWVDEINKTAIMVRDSPGFASSRLGVAIGLEAIRMVEEGVASPEDIDTAMVLGYKYPIGPLRLADLVGLDVRLGICEYLEDELGPRFAAPELLRRMVAAGTLGRKTGQGFFTWPEPDR